MTSRFQRLLFAAGCLPLVVFAADEVQSKSNVSDAIKARLAEQAKQGKTPPANTARTETAAKAAQPAPAPAAQPVAKATGTVTPAEAAKAQKETPTVLDPVEVRKRKLSEFERDLQKQEADIIREKKLTVPTETDKALNDSKLSKALAIFGGESSEFRANMAKERVSMMEDEKDIIEAINHAKTKEEKQELQKQLDELKKMRRELEQSLK